jgi:hypothetical protein
MPKRSNLALSRVLSSRDVRDSFRPVVHTTPPSTTRSDSPSTAIQIPRPPSSSPSSSASALVPTAFHGKLADTAAEPRAASKKKLGKRKRVDEEEEAAGQEEEEDDEGLDQSNYYGIDEQEWASTATVFRKNGLRDASLAKCALSAYGCLCFCSRPDETTMIYRLVPALPSIFNVRLRHSHGSRRLVVRHARAHSAANRRAMQVRSTHRRLSHQKKIDSKPI